MLAFVVIDAVVVLVIVQSRRTRKNLAALAAKLGFQVETDRPVLTVIAQTFHPNWHARVNGVEVRIERADYAFQALRVPPGRNTVTLVYRDRKFQAGLALTAATLLLVAALVWRAKPTPEKPARKIAR